MQTETSPLQGDASALECVIFSASSFYQQQKKNFETQKTGNLSF